MGIITVRFFFFGFQTQYAEPNAELEIEIKNGIEIGIEIGIEN